MKSIHNKAKQPEIKYPCLMVANNGDIVLFSEERKGIKIVNGTGGDLVGSHSNTWIMKHFKPLPTTESVTLQND